MGFFSSTDTVDGKARRVLGNLSGDSSAFEILQTVDQEAGENVDPDDVVSTMRDLDDEVDAKLSTVEGEDVDQKDMRAAAGTIAERADMSQTDAMDLLSDIASGDVDQAALTTLADGEDMSSDENTSDTTSTDTGGADDGTVDQKQDDDGGDGDGGNAGPLDMLNDDAREAVEDFAELAGKDPEECVQQVLGDGDAGDVGAGAAAGANTADNADADMNAGSPDRGYDQKLGDVDLNEKVAEAVTSDEVLDEMAGAVAQKMADDETLADNLVETVDQKGDFVTTDDAVVTAPGGESETVSEAGAITGGDGE